MNFRCPESRKFPAQLHRLVRHAELAPAIPAGFVRMPTKVPAGHCQPLYPRQILKLRTLAQRPRSRRSSAAHLGHGTLTAVLDGRDGAAPFRYKFETIPPFDTRLHRRRHDRGQWIATPLREREWSLVATMQSTSKNRRANSSIIKLCRYRE